MADAFRCDSCGQFREGQPTLLKVQINMSDTRVDLCLDCTDAFEADLDGYTRGDHVEQNSTVSPTSEDEGGDGH